MNMLGDATMNTSMSLDRVERLLTRSTSTQCIHTNDNRNDGMSCVDAEARKFVRSSYRFDRWESKKLSMIETFPLNFVEITFLFSRAASAEKRTIGILRVRGFAKDFKTFCCSCHDYCLKFLSVKVWNFGLSWQLLRKFRKLQESIASSVCCVQTFDWYLIKSQLQNNLSQLSEILQWCSRSFLNAETFGLQKLLSCKALLIYILKKVVEVGS